MLLLLHQQLLESLILAFSVVVLDYSWMAPLLVSQPNFLTQLAKIVLDWRDQAIDEGNTNHECLFPGFLVAVNNDWLSLVLLLNL